MRKKASGYTKKQLIAPMAAACLLLVGLLFYPQLLAASSPKAPAAQSAEPVYISPSPVPTAVVETAAEVAGDEPLSQNPAPDRSGLRISELMCKNHSTLMDELGALPDWIELENSSDAPISLQGLSLSDDETKPGWPLPDMELAPGARLLVYTDGGNIRGETLHTDFSLSFGEWLYLRDERGETIDEAQCTSDEVDVALALNAQGEWTETMFPSPGYTNDELGYAQWQDSLGTADDGLVISEVMVYNDSQIKQNLIGYCDWLELENRSGESVELSDYYLSDDDDALQLWRLPERQLAPGERALVLCTASEQAADTGYIKLGFELSSDGEQLFLTDKRGTLADFVFVHDVPYGASFGRMAGQPGWFYMSSPSPGAENAGGCRLISHAPVSLTADGVYEDVDGLEVSLSAAGDIYYTTDGSRPGIHSARYTAPIELSSTTVVRAVAIEEGRLPSAVTSLSYIINEGHTLPVMSLVTDDPEAFRRMYDGRRKDMELPGALALYEKDGGFSLPCGIEMHGMTSLELPKKNMSVRFRTAYGQESLSYDAFGGGVTQFTNFVLRSGQDFTDTIFRNELLENLALRMSDNILSQRSKHCVLYINGQYRGLYALMEKVNEQHYAYHRGVSKDSVTVVRDWAGMDSDFYTQVISFANTHDLTSSSGYRQFCRIVDIDSLIDWMIAEGYSGNSDIASGNLRYCRSTEDDGLWRFMLYDMDATLEGSINCFGNVLRPNSTECAVFITQLMENSEFRQRFLSRAGEALRGEFSNESVVAEIDRLSALISGEVERDYARFNMSLSQWEGAVSALRSSIVEQDRAGRCVDALCQYFRLSEQERMEYFGF